MLSIIEILEGSHVKKFIKLNLLQPPTTDDNQFSRCQKTMGMYVEHTLTSIEQHIMSAPRAHVKFQIDMKKIEANLHWFSVQY